MSGGQEIITEAIEAINLRMGTNNIHGILYFRIQPEEFICGIIRQTKLQDHTNTKDRFIDFAGVSAIQDTPAWRISSHCTKKKMAGS